MFRSARKKKQANTLKHAKQDEVSNSGFFFFLKGYKTVEFNM